MVCKRTSSLFCDYSPKSHLHSGNTIDFMDAQKRRIFSRFSPEAPYIRGVDICGDLIGNYPVRILSYSIKPAQQMRIGIT